MRQITIILNPKSGRGQGAKKRGELGRLLTLAAKSAPIPVSWRIMETQRHGGGTEAAREAAQAGADIVAAAGGDGTLNEVLNGVMGTKAVLGLLPLGTGNDFARCLGLGTDLPRAVETLVNGAPRIIDVGRAQERWFLNIAGCGFDAIVAERTNRGFPLLRGTPAYLASIGISLLNLAPARFTLTLDGKPRTARLLMCSIANATSYGGGMRVAPDAKIDDGLFDLCLLGDAGRIEFIRAFPRVFKGTHTTHPRVTMLRARHVKIETEPPLPVLIDGEVMGTTPVEFTLLPGAIQIMAPV